MIVVPFLVAFACGVLVGGGLVMWWAHHELVKPEAEVLINGKPAWQFGIWSEHPDVKVYAVHEGFASWAIWTIQEGQESAVRVSRQSASTRGEVETLGFRNGVLPTEVKHL